MELQSASEAYEQAKKKRFQEVKDNIMEWNSYLPKVKAQSIDVLIENIFDIIE